MAEKTRLVWSKSAQIERKEIFSYWNKRNGSTAYSNKLNILIKDTLQAIIDHPYSGQSTNIDAVRYYVARDYLLLYEIAEKQILILCMWDGRQDPEKLKKRLE